MDDSDDFEMDDEYVDEDDAFTPDPHPFSWRAAVGMTLNYIATLADATSTYLHSLAVEAISSANHEAGRREFHEEATLAIEQIAGGMDG